MHIVLAFDDNYAIHSRVLMESIIDRTSPDVGTDFTFWLAGPKEFDTEFRSTVQRQLDGRADVRFLPARGHVLDLPLSANKFGSYISHAAYSRLMVPEDLPEWVDRFVYIDCDVLCASSIAELATVDLQGATVGAVRDVYTRRFFDQGRFPGLSKYPHISPDANYFNSGVLVVEVAEWKRKRVTERALEYVADNEKETRFPDQDALNYALYGHWHRLPAKWNYMMTWRLEPEVGGKLSNAALIHTPGPFKFWSDDFPNSARRDLYWHYRNLLDT